MKDLFGIVQQNVISLCVSFSPALTHLLVLTCPPRTGAELGACGAGCSSAMFGGALFLVRLAGPTMGETGSSLSGTWCRGLHRGEVKVLKCCYSDSAVFRFGLSRQNSWWVEGSVEPVLEHPQEGLREAWVDNRQKNSCQVPICLPWTVLLAKSKSITVCEGGKMKWKIKFEASGLEVLQYFSGCRYWDFAWLKAEVRMNSQLHI